MDARQLWDEDPVFQEVARSLGVGSADEVEGIISGLLVSKSSPDPADVHVAAVAARGKRRRKPLIPIRKGAGLVARKVLPYAIGGGGTYAAATTYGPESQHRSLKQVQATVAPNMYAKQRQYRANKLAEKQRKKLKGTFLEDEQPLLKSVDWEGEFTKFDTDKRQVFGWASIVSVNGKPVVDRQGDLIDADEMEKSAYEYVIKSRRGGDQHRRTDDGQAFHASDMIESFVVTPEKKDRLGLPDDMPVGWWVGFKVNDDDTWRKVKNGEVTGFSIHGKGKRIPVDGVLDPVSTTS